MIDRSVNMAHTWYILCCTPKNALSHVKSDFKYQGDRGCWQGVRPETKIHVAPIQHRRIKNRPCNHSRGLRKHRLSGKGFENFVHHSKISFNLERMNKCSYRRRCLEIIRDNPQQYRSVQSEAQRLNILNCMSPFSNTSGKISVSYNVDKKNGSYSTVDNRIGDHWISSLSAEDHLDLLMPADQLQFMTDLMNGSYAYQVSEYSHKVCYIACL